MPEMPIPAIPVWLCARAICGAEPARAGVEADAGTGVSEDLRGPGACVPAGTGAGAIGA